MCGQEVGYLHTNDIEWLVEQAGMGNVKIDHKGRLVNLDDQRQEEEEESEDEEETERRRREEEIKNDPFQQAQQQGGQMGMLQSLGSTQVHGAKIAGAKGQKLGKA